MHTEAQEHMTCVQDTLCIVYVTPVLPQKQLLQMEFHLIPFVAQCSTVQVHIKAIPDLFLFILLVLLLLLVIFLLHELKPGNCGVEKAHNRRS